MLGRFGRERQLKPSATFFKVHIRERPLNSKEEKVREKEAKQAVSNAPQIMQAPFLPACAVSNCSFYCC